MITYHLSANFNFKNHLNIIHTYAYAGFLSLDCGLPVNYSGYTDALTGIVYVSDDPYVDAGETHTVSAAFEATWANFRHMRTLRSFPSGVRNCYTLPTEAGAKYLLQMQLGNGNYDGKNAWVEFDVHLGANIYWGSVTASPAIDSVHEWVFVAWASWAPVCLVNTGHGTPFVSALDLRRLPGALYPPVNASMSLKMYQRQNMGANDAFLTR